MQLSNTRIHHDALEYHRRAVEENPNLDSIVLTLGNNIFMYLTNPELTKDWLLNKQDMYEKDKLGKFLPCSYD
jgi:hypothetical protein